MHAVEGEGDSIDAAIERALGKLGVSRDRAEIEILTGGSRGLFGIGSRPARVRATLRAPIGAAGGEEHPRADLPAAPAVPAPARVAASDPGERAAQVLTEIVRLAGVSADVVLRREPDHTVLELGGDSTGVLIGRRGQMLDALEYVLNRIVIRDDEGAAHIVVDSHDYRVRRQAALEELARRMGEQAKKKRRPVTLTPMSPRDRRVVHLVLQGDPGLTTKSAGQGHFRRLVIIPAGTTRGPRNDR